MFRVAFLIAYFFLFHHPRPSGAHESTGLTFELPDKERMCFYEDFEGSRTYVLEYEVLSGGNNDVDVSIDSPTGASVYSEIRKTRDVVPFIISWGKYTFCFSNEFSTFTHKRVYFELRPEEHEPLAVEGGKKGAFVNTQMEESMEAIHRHATEVMKFQKVYRANEARGRYEADQLNQTVQWWSLTQSFIILIAGLGEIVILKRFFTHRRDGPSSLTNSLLVNARQEVVHVPPVVRP